MWTWSTFSGLLAQIQHVPLNEWLPNSIYLSVPPGVQGANVEGLDNNSYILMHLRGV